MFQIKDLLERFKSIRDPKEVRNTLSLAINKQIGGDLIKDDMLSVKNNILWIKANPAIRSKIFMNKNRCLEAVRKIDQENIIIDIR